MFKIDGPNTVAGMPARGAIGALPGWFEQAPGAGSGTVVTGEYLNMWQAEFLAVLSAAGIAPNKAADNQILLAIQAIAASLSGWSTGDVKLTYKIVADAGWLMMNDGTIGKAGSGATYANAAAEPLFTLLYNNIADAEAPVSGGRGAGAAADFAAGKTLTLCKALGRALGIAGAGAGLTARALGKTVGAETHNHGGSTGASGNVQSTANGPGVVASHPDHQNPISADTTLQPTAFLNAMIKL